jgi:hypothetical protein
MAEQAGKCGALYAQTGSKATLTDKPIGTGNASDTVFYLQEVTMDCEAVSPTASGSLLAGDWTSSGATGQTLTADGTDMKEGTYCIKNDVTTVVGAQTCLCLFTMDDVQDWHDRTYMLFWLRCELAQSGFTSARFEVVDSSSNRSYWNLTFAAATWTRQALLLGTPDGNSGTAADLTDVKKVQLSFVAADATTFYQELDWMGITPQAVDKDITLKLAGTTQGTDKYLHTVSGKVTLNTAPGGSVAVTATYDEYAIAQVGGFFNWSIAQAVGILDKTDFQSNSWKEFLGGLKEWSGSAERHWMTNESLDTWLGVTKIIKFFMDESSDPQLRYEGWAIIKGLNPAVAIDTIINESLDFQGTGQLSYEST